MTPPLEFHSDHADFLTGELERLAAQKTTWADCFGALVADNSLTTSPFDRVVEGFCEQLVWPPMRGLDLARACARLHFAVWLTQRQPWEVVEQPATGKYYLKRVLIDQYWLHRQRWIVESWAGLVLDDE